MNIKSILVVALLSFTTASFSNVITGKSANTVIKGASEIRYTEQSTAPSFILFKVGEQPNASGFNQLMSGVFKNSPETSFRLVKSVSDELGYIHSTYQ